MDLVGWCFISSSTGHHHVRFGLPLTPAYFLCCMHDLFLVSENHSASKVSSITFKRHALLELLYAELILDALDDEGVARIFRARECVFHSLYQFWHDWSGQSYLKKKYVHPPS